MAHQPVRHREAAAHYQAVPVLDGPAARSGGAQGAAAARSPVSPFRNILRLSAGDFVAKVFYFLALVYMAKTLGVAGYGVLEFAIAIRTYLLLAADGGLELWAVREVAKGRDVRKLAARVVPLRLALAGVAYIAVNVLIMVAPGNPNLKRILPVFALTAFLQAVNLKWVFMGQREMSRIAPGLVLGQAVFALPVLLFINRPEHLIWAPLPWLAGELIMAVYFGRLFSKTYGGLRLPFTIRDSRSMLRPSATLGASQALGLMNYNVDSILLGVLLGPGPVGWYAAAYKPVTAALALPVSYFIGLFPTLSNAFKRDRQAFRDILGRSARLTAIFAMPIGIAGTLLADPIIDALFGPDYHRSADALKLLSWSAVLVTLRGNFRHALNAAGRYRLDLYCAAAAVTVNVVLNLTLIPKYKLIGAAGATLASETLWLALVIWLCKRHVGGVPLNVLWRPLAAAAILALFLWTMPLFWIVRAAAGAFLYFGVLALLGEREITSKLSILRKLAPPRDLRATY